MNFSKKTWLKLDGILILLLLIVWVFFTKFSQVAKAPNNDIINNNLNINLQCTAQFA